MARNKVFRRKYMIEFKGVTTNDFMVTLLDEIVARFVTAVASEYETLNLKEYEVIDTTEVKK